MITDATVCCAKYQQVSTLEGSVSWKKFHWKHYALIESYNKDTDNFQAFDEKQGNYVRFEVSLKTLFSSIFVDEEGERFIYALNLSNQIQPMTFRTEKIIKFSQNICTSIDLLPNEFFSQMSDNDFRARSHMELIGVYLQRIEGRQKANHLLMEYLQKERGECVSVDVESFEKLAENWREIRLDLYRNYFDDKRRRNGLKKINRDIKNVLNQKKRLWSKTEERLMRARE